MMVFIKFMQIKIIFFFFKDLNLLNLFDPPGKLLVILLNKLFGIIYLIFLGKGSSFGGWRPI